MQNNLPRKDGQNPRVLVISPSGEVYDRDCVRWYSCDDVQRSIEHYHNIGDAFVYDSSLKLLNFTDIGFADIRDVRPADIDRYNAEFDYCLLRGSNYIHGEMDWENAVAVLAKLKIPVLAFGVGAQAPAKGDLILSETTIKVMRLIADRCVSVGVRGEYTADVLWNLGIKNSRVIGCPTLFRRNRPELRIDLPPLEQVRDIAFTLRREVSWDYAHDINIYQDVQRRAIVDLAGRFSMEISAQGEVEEKKIVLGRPDQRQAAFEQLIAEGWLSGPDDPLCRLYESRLFYSDVVADYERTLGSKDLVLGYRLHGNLMALANGVPSVYFTYDSRTAEFVDTFRIPSFDVYSGKPFRLEEYWDQTIFERFNRTCRQRYQDMGAFLDENGISHKMVGQSRPSLRLAS